MTKIKPLTYQQQYDYYSLLCEDAVISCTSAKEYRACLMQIRADLKKDPDYALLAQAKFRPPAMHCVRSAGVASDQASIADLVAEKA